MAANPPLNQEHQPAQEPPDKILSFKTPTGALTIGGLAFIFVSLGAMLAMLISLYLARNASGEFDHNNAASVLDFYLKNYSPPLIAFVASLMASLIGYGLLRAAGTATKEVIPIKDYELLKDMLVKNNNEGISNYIKLSSLSGTIGSFTKVGLSGLPLATIALTVFFALMGAILIKTQGNASSSLFDLARLTLGAFIGSYVQRQTSDVQRQFSEAQGEIARAQSRAAEPPKS